MLLRSKNEIGQRQGEHSGEGSSRVGAGTQTLEQGHLGGVFLRLDEEGAQSAEQMMPQTASATGSSMPLQP